LLAPTDTGGFRAAGQRIWKSLVVTYLIAAVQRFIAEDPANELEATIFKAIRDVVEIVKRRFKKSESAGVGPDS
jgi:hypothetical protein